MINDRIRLIVPARGEYARTVRLTASALADRMNASYDEVDDVRMAAEEAFVYAVDTLGDGDDVEMTFVVTDESLEIVARVGATAGADDALGERTQLATFILDSVCESHEFASDESGWRVLRLVTRCGCVDGDD